MITRLFPALFLAAALVDAQEENGATELTPTLDLLPKGSRLENVRIPRFDRDKNPAALLCADLMKVVTKNFITANGVSLTTFEPDGTHQLEVQMKAADFHVQDNILEAHDSLIVEGQRFHARGQGAIFQLDSRRAFIHGPVQTRITSAPTTSMRFVPPLSPYGILLLGPLVMAMPEPLSTSETEELDTLTAPTGQELLSEVARTNELVTRSEQLAQLSSVGFRSFAMEIGQPGLTTITTGTTEQADDPEREPPTNPGEGLHITCEGGMYVDAEKGHVVYLKNIVVKEPRFDMTAKQELKIFLDQKPESSKPASQEKPSGKNGSKAPSFEGSADFGEIKSIIATGGVKVIAKEVKSGPVTAISETATYDAKTGDIILRGGFPTVREGKKYVRAKEPGLYIRIYANGNVYFQPGKWETFADTEGLELDR